MRVEWWITEWEEVKHLARRAQRNRLGLWGASEHVRRQSFWHLYALCPACAATPPLLTNCWPRWQDIRWACIKRGNGKPEQSKSRVGCGKGLFYLCLVMALQHVSAQQSPHHLARSPALLQHSAPPRSRGLLTSRNQDMGSVETSVTLSVADHRDPLCLPWVNEYQSQRIKHSRHPLYNP